MPEAIPEFTEAERDAVDLLLHRRCGQPTPIELADAGISLDPGSDESTLSLALRWATPRLRVNLSLVPIVARTAAAGTGIAR
jgi:hypothetical protein